MAALAVVATLLGVIPAAAWPWTTLVYTMAAMLSVTTTNFFVARATADWGSTIAPKVFFFGGMAALLAGAIAIGGRLSLALVTNQSAAAIGFIVALVIAGILAAIAVAIARDGIARVESVLGNELLESERIPTDHAGSSIRVSAPAHPADLAPLPLEPERPPIRRSGPGVIQLTPADQTPDSARSIARPNAAALSTVSFHSAAGEESSTMPAPA